MAAKALFLDGPSLAYRCILGLGPNLSSGSGEPTRGTYTFCQSFMKLVKRVNPDYLAVAWDAPRSSLWRREWYEGYKAKRREADDELIVQVERIQQILGFWGVPLLIEDRWEADDVLASLADICAGPSCDVLISTSDKDMMQLVDVQGDRVTLIHPTELTVTDCDGVVDKWGVGPDRMVPLQTLMGDPVDGIPGVKGIGHKKALALLDTYGDVQNVRRAAEKGDLTPAQAKAILDTDLALMERLVTLEKGLDVNVSSRELEYDGLDMNAARPIFRSLGFARWE
jgi:DNA polymerase-1